MRPIQLARLAGSIHLVQIVAGSFPMYVRSQLVVPDDGATTAAQVLAAETLYRLGMLSEVVTGLTWLSIAFTLYVLFRTVHREAATLFVILTILGVAALELNVVHLGGALALFEGSVSGVSFDATQLQSLAMIQLALFNKGLMVFGLFAGLWLLPLGWVVLRSHYVPRIFGVGLMVGCFGYVIPVVTTLLAPEYEAIRQLIIVSGLAEVSFGLWLLIRGVKVPVRRPPEG